MEESLLDDYFDVDYLFANSYFDDIKRGSFGESKHSKIIQRPSNKNKYRRHATRKESNTLYIKKQANKEENKIEHRTRHQTNFWKTHTPIQYQFTQSSITSSFLDNLSSKVPTQTPTPISSSSSTQTPTPTPTPTPIPVPTVFQAPRSDYERDLQVALKASTTDKHESGLSYQSLMDLSSRELTPEDYEMLLLLDSVVEKKTTNLDVLQNINETIADKDTTGDCPICMCDFTEGDKLKHLKCSHTFHIDCITEWLSKHSQTCPLCKESVL